MKRSSLLPLIFLSILFTSITLISWWIFDWARVPGGLWEFLGKAAPTLLAAVVDFLTIFTLWRTLIGSQETSHPLRKVTPEEIRAKLGTGGTIPWVDRERTQITDLIDRGRVLISGRMKQGKTREAAELIRRAIQHELVNENAIYQPNPIAVSTGISRETLFQGMDTSQAILLFIDDLPFHYPGKNQLDKLGAVISLLTVFKEHYIVATARSEQMKAVHRAWIKKQNFKTIRFGGLKSEQMETFLASASRVYGLTLDEAARQELLLYARRDNRPETLRIALNLLAEEFSSRQIDAETARQTAKRSLRESFDRIRFETEKAEPKARFFFQALGAAHAARLEPNLSLILTLAGYLCSRETYWLGCARTRKGVLSTLEFLANFDTLVIDEVVQYPDPLVENLFTQDEAVALIDPFLSRYLARRARKWLRWLVHNRYQLSKTAFELAFLYQIDDALDKAVEYYTYALLLEPGEAQYYYNRGVVHVDRGDLRQAIQDFSKAMQLDPLDEFAARMRAETYMRQGNIASAAHDISQAEKLAPDHPYTHAVRARLLFLQGDYQASLEKYKAAQSLADDPTAFHFDIALPMLCLGQVEDALGLMERHMNDAQPYEIKEALAWFEDLKARQPDLPGLDEALALLRGG